MIDHAALRAEIDTVRDETRNAFNALWDAMRKGTKDEYDAALEDWRRKTERYDTLIKAGVLVTLGPLEDTDEEPRRDVG